MKKKVLPVLIIAIHFTVGFCTCLRGQDTCYNSIVFSSSHEVSFETKGKDIKVLKGDKDFARDDFMTIKELFQKQSINADTIQLFNEIYKYIFYKDNNRADSLVIFFYKVEIKNSVADMNTWFNKENNKDMKGILLSKEMPVTAYYFNPQKDRLVYLFAHYGLPDYYKDFDIRKSFECIIKNMGK